MMSLLGFVLVTAIGLAGLFGGMAMLWATSTFGSVHKSDTLAGLVITVAGGGLLYWGFADAPFVIAMRGAL